MRGKFFVDTNVFVYSFDNSAPTKRQQARELIKSALQSGKGHISFQVIQKFFNVATRKFTSPMSLSGEVTQSGNASIMWFGYRNVVGKYFSGSFGNISDMFFTSSLVKKIARFWKGISSRIMSTC